MRIRASSEKKLLDAADALFFSRGVAGTPIGTLIDRAGVSPATLYRGYASKDDLVAAALDRRHRQWSEVWERAIDRQTSLRDRLLAVFEALEEFRARPDGARWCAFLGSAAEFADPPAEIARAITQDTDLLRARLLELTAPLGEPAASSLVDDFMLLVTGYLAMRLRDPDHTTSTARAIASTLLADLPPVSPSTAGGDGGGG